MVLDLPKATHPHCSTTGGGRVGSDGLLISSHVAAKGNVEGLTGTAVSDESSCSTSRLAGLGGIKIGDLLIPSDFARY